MEKSLKFLILLTLTPFVGEAITENNSSCQDALATAPQSYEFVYNEDFEDGPAAIINPEMEAKLLAFKQAMGGLTLRPKNYYGRERLSINHPFPSAELERYIFRKFNYLKWSYPESSSAEIEELRNLAMLSYQRFVLKLATKQSNTRFPPEYLFTELQPHLLKIIDKFDYDLGWRFVVYFNFTAVREISTIKRGRYAQNRFEGRFESIDAASAYPRFEAFAPAQASEGEVSNSFPLIEKYLSIVTPRQAEVMTLSFGLKDGIFKNNQEVGDIIGSTKENVRLILKNALKRITEYNLENGIEGPW